MLRDVLALVSGLPAAFADRFRPRPIADVEDLVWFVRTRAAYVAQTSLYGYLKTRMGTKFRVYFEDEAFAGLIRGAATGLFVSCAADLSVFAAAVAGRDGGLDPAESAGLARRCFAGALDGALAEIDRAHVPADAHAAFAARAERTNWIAAARGETAFQASPDDLVRVAPIVDELKALDREIVRNSIRFRWRDVREQLRKRMREEAVCRSWRAAMEDSGAG